MKHKINHANIKDWAASYDGPLFDAILCDPPYELGFMGKSWDSSGIAFDKDMWADLFKLVKPGGHLLAFSGSRTYHRMAVAIEDAGFEIRDMIEWVYGSGFPKSLNIGKAVDKTNGQAVDWFGKWLREWRKENNINQKEVAKLFPSKTGGLTGCVANWELGLNMPTNEQFNLICKTFNLPFESLQEAEREFVGKHSTDMGGLGGERLGQKGGDITKGNSPYEGYGTALKPAHESICVAHKPLETCTEIEYITSICQTLFVEIAKESSGCNLSDKTQQGIAQWTAEKNISTLADLLEVMDMLQSLEKDNTNLSIVLSWLNTLAESWQVSNTYTTSTKLNMITELRILDSLEWGNILPSITQAKSNPTGGLSADAYNAASLLNAVKLKLHDTLTRSANVSATFSENPEDLRPSHEPICLARKPLESTVANNVLKHGTGGLNIDGTRIPTQEHLGRPQAQNSESNPFSKGLKSNGYNDNSQGKRFPANLIHDGSDEVEAVFPQTKNGGGNSTSKRETWLRQETEPTQYAGDKGSASRFFYTAKSSRSERNSGLDSTRTVKYNTGICKDDNTELVQLLRKATSELTMRWLTDESGVNIMAQCQSDSLSTILTTINKITTSQILSLWMHSHTNESTQAANSEMASGGSPARSAESSSSSAKTDGISQKRGGLSTEDVSRVISELLSLIKDEENWQPSSNIHSTVKPLSLTRYLATLIKPPTGGRLLVPFSGSGSEMIGALQAGWEYVEGVELTEEYIPIAEARIAHWIKIPIQETLL